MRKCKFCTHLQERRSTLPLSTIYAMHVGDYPVIPNIETAEISTCPLVLSQQLRSLSVEQATHQDRLFSLHYDSPEYGPFVLI